MKIKRARSKEPTTKPAKTVRKKVRIEKTCIKGWPVNGSVGKSKILDQRPDKKQDEALRRLIRKEAGAKAAVSSPVLIPLNGTLSTCNYFALRMAVRVGNRIVGTVSLQSPKSTKLVWRDRKSFGFFEVRGDNLPAKPS